MEWFLSLFIFHDAYVVSFLVLAIAIIVVLLLIFNHKSPQSVVDGELGSPRGVEEALRRVLGDKSILENFAELSPTEPNVEKLKEEVLLKDRTIAELNKKLTQSPSGSSSLMPIDNDSEELRKKIAELEAQLQEYELIEDDIADLSTYRAENEKLKEALRQLKSQLGDSSESGKDAEISQDSSYDESLGSEAQDDQRVTDSTGIEPDTTILNSQESGSSVRVEDAEVAETQITKIDSQEMDSNTLILKPDEIDQFVEKSESSDPVSLQQGSSTNGSEDSGSHEGLAQDGTKNNNKSKNTQVAQQEDLLSAFEKVVSQQDKIPNPLGGGGGVSVIDSSLQNNLSQHPKPKDLKPDSKEEADVFINELKSLRKGS